MRHTLLVCILLFGSSTSFAQSEADFEKLATVCKAWGLIKYFHPDKPTYRFDSAFAAQVPAMLAADNDETWEQAFHDWLSVLDDPMTELTKTSFDPHPTDFSKEITADSILLVKIDGANFFDDYYTAQEFLLSVIKEAKKTRGIIFDLRQSAKIPADYQDAFSLYFGYLGVSKALATNTSPPQYRSLYYSGFVPERGGSSGGYSESAVLNSLPQASSPQSKKIVTVWITNKYAQLPDVAISEQAVGNAFIVHDSKELESLLPSTSGLPFTDDYSIKFRTKAVLMANNASPSADAVYRTADEALAIAKKFLLNPSHNKLTSNQEMVTQPAKPSKLYPKEKLPDVGYRVLAAAKIFTVIDHFFPYHQYMDRDWHEVLVESLPQFVSAKSEMEYGKAVARMYANIQDSHGYISGNVALDELFGEASPPMSVDWIEDKVVVTGFHDASACQEKGIDVGDIILKVDGQPVEVLAKEHNMYYAHSTPQAIEHRAARRLVRGKEGEIGVFTIQNQEGDIRDVELYWRQAYQTDSSDQPALDTLALIGKDIGYADLTRMTPDQTDAMFEKFKATKAIIFDMRGYPNGTAWSIAPRLTEKKNVPLALFRRLEVLHPNVKEGEILNSRTYSEFIQTVPPSNQWKYQGKTVMLINHDAVSQSEHTGLFFKSVDSTTFIGTPTTGANGDVTNFEIPGDMFLNFSGQGVWHTDGKQLQRLGLQPDVLVIPTIEGIKQRKDEILDKAVEWIQKNIE